MGVKFPLARQKKSLAAGHRTTPNFEHWFTTNEVTIYHLICIRIHIQKVKIKKRAQSPIDSKIKMTKPIYIYINLKWEKPLRLC